MSIRASKALRLTSRDKFSDSSFTPLGFDANPMEFDLLKTCLHTNNFKFTEVTSEADVTFRLIHYESKLLNIPYFLTLEFHERPGALADFLSAVSPHANLCYFNYVYSGERVGRALLGFEFDTLEQSAKFAQALESAKNAYRSYEPISATTLQRIVGSS